MPTLFAGLVGVERAWAVRYVRWLKEMGEEPPDLGLFMGTRSEIRRLLRERMNAERGPSEVVCIEDYQSKEESLRPIS